MSLNSQCILKIVLKGISWFLTNSHFFPYSNSPKSGEKVYNYLFFPFSLPVPQIKLKILILVWHIY